MLFLSETPSFITSLAPDSIESLLLNMFSVTWYNWQTMQHSRI